MTMKKNIIVLFICACWCMLLVASCESDLPKFANYSAYTFSNLTKMAVPGLQ